MKTQCDVVRDLMPLCIDGAASAESTKYVDEHVAECEECKAYYEKMKAVIPKREGTEEGQEQAEFGKAAELMKLKHRRRVRRNVLIGILIGILAVFGIFIGWQELVVNNFGQIPIDQYDVSLAQLKDGPVIVSVDYKNSKREMGTGIFEGLKYTNKPFDSAENPYILRIWMNTGVIPRYSERPHRNGPLYVMSNTNEIDLIVIGKSDERIVWRRGEEIPKASEALEAYYQANDDMMRYEFGLPIIQNPVTNFSGDDLEEEMRKTKILHDKWEELRQQVPEWQ